VKGGARTYASIYTESMALLKNPDSPLRSEDLPAGLASIGLERSVSPGAVLFGQDEEAESCFLLLRGEVALRRVSLRGDEIEIARIHPGEWFGEAVLFAARRYPARAVVVAGGSVREFRRAQIFSSGDPEVLPFFLSLLARKCLALTARIDQLTVMDARARLASFILGLCPGGAAGCSGGRLDCSFPLPKKKREIAIELGMTPETLSRTFRRMEAEGLFKVKGALIEIPSCSRLRGIAEEA